MRNFFWLVSKKKSTKGQNETPINMSSRDAISRSRHIMPSTRKQGDASAVLSYQEDPNPSRCVSTSKFRLLCLFVVVGDCLLNFATLAFVGLALKWDLTFGDEAPHRHPHVPEENYIQRPNNLLSIIMISTSLNFAESIVLLVFYCCNMRRPPSFNPCYRSLRVAALFYSWLCIVLVGMSLAACWALQMNLYPPDLRFIGCQHPSECELVCMPPVQLSPPPPPPVSPVLPSGEVYLLYALCVCIALFKFASYGIGIPFSVIRWKFTSVYE
jgi:hypothetical protein